MVKRIEEIPFKFKVGQIVKHRLGGKVLIIERWYQECINTWQIHYTCRICTQLQQFKGVTDGNFYPDRAFTLNEIELEEIRYSEATKCENDS